MGLGKKELYILEYTRVFDPSQEKFTTRVSLPSNCTSDDIDAAYLKMVMANEKHLDRRNALELASQKQEVKEAYGETEKNATNRSKIKGSANRGN